VLQRALATPARRQLQAYAATQPGVWGRVGSMLRVLDAAASTDESLIELRTQLDTQRLAGLRRFAALLAERRAAPRSDHREGRRHPLDRLRAGQLRQPRRHPGMDRPLRRYRNWLTDVLISSLLPQESKRRPAD
jgi:hypothetical protein